MPARSAFPAVALLAIALWLAGAFTGARAQEAGEFERPVLIRADELINDRDLGVTVARGNVEVLQGERVLLADTISYNQRTNTVAASGEVTLLEPTGEVLFADYMELSNEMRDGVIQEMRILLDETARIAARGARRTGGVRTEMSRAVYSPCEVCEEAPERPPLWQVKADRVIHDSETKTVQYRNARLEMLGVPIAYTPYFQHPDPTVRRKSGFLVPSWGSDSNLGFFAEIPYFWAIGDDKDATLRPIVTDDEGIVAAGEYRQAFDRGDLEVSASLTKGTLERDDNGDRRAEQTEEWRGHLFAEGDFALDETWRARFDINRASDKTYLDRYNFFERPDNALSSNTLISEAAVEGFRGRSFVQARAIDYQDLRLGVFPEEPTIAPQFRYAGLGDMDGLGGRWSLDAEARSIYQEDVADTHVMSLGGGYRLPYTTGFGLVTTLEAELRGDVYVVDQDRATDDRGQPVDDDTIFRGMPWAKAEVRYPFMRQGTGGQQVIEPIVAAILAPNGGNDPDIPNQDSVLAELDENTLFDINRTPGLDRVEGGQRVVYGLNLGHYTRTGHIRGFLGQSQRLRDDQDLSAETGIETGASDYVGRLDASPHEYVSLYYRFRLAEDDLTANRSEASVAVGPSAFRVSANYGFYRGDTDLEFADREQASVTLDSRISRFWRGRLFTTRDLLDDGGSLFNGGSLTYEDECFIFTAQLDRSFTRKADVEPTDRFLFRLTFKTLGEVESGL